MDTIKINKTGEVAKTIMEITSLLDEYCRIIDEDLQTLKYAAHNVAVTTEAVGKRRRELQEQMNRDYNQLRNCEMGLTECGRHFRTLETCDQELEQLKAIERNMKNEMEKALNAHSVFQTKIMPLLEQIEAAY